MQVAHHCPPGRQHALDIILGGSHIFTLVPVPYVRASVRVSKGLRGDRRPGIHDPVPSARGAQADLS